jgi:CP family cyanate transporter-like MFS transporter
MDVQDYAKYRKKSRIVLGCAWLIGFAMFCPILCIPPIAFIIKQELRISHAAVGFLFSLPVTVLVVLALPSGLLADRLGTKRAVGIGASVMAAGSLMRGMSDSYATLVALTILYGVGFCIIYPNLPKLVGLWFPREKAGLATGIYTTGITTGAGISLAITLPLVFPLAGSIRGTFFLWSIPAVAATVLWWVLVKDPPPPSYPAGRGSGEGRAHRPSSPLWKNRNMWMIALMLFFNNLHFYTWSGWAPALMMMKGASPDLAALIASFRAWVGLPMIFLIPWISYRVGVRKPFIWGSGLLLACASWSAIYLPAPLGWTLMAVVAICTGGTFPMILAFLLEMLPNQSVGKASGTVLSIGYIGGLGGPWLAGYIVDSTASLDLALVLLGGTAILWAWIGFSIPETGRKALGPVCSR